MDSLDRPIAFIASSEKDLSKLPIPVKRIFAHGLRLASRGETPPKAKSLKGYSGRSVVELLEDYRTDTYRAIYTVKFKKAVYVLHVFKKKSKKGISTPKREVQLVENRLKLAAVDYKKRFSEVS